MAKVEAHRQRALSRLALPATLALASLLAMRRFLEV